MKISRMLSRSPRPDNVIPRMTSRITDSIMRTKAITIRIVVNVCVSIWRGVFLEVNFFALESICDAYDSWPNAVTMKYPSPVIQTDPE